MERIESLDTLKGLALFAVVILHIQGNFVGEEIPGTLFNFISLNISRFGVPVFFLISGFLFKRKLEAKDNGKKYVLDYLKKLSYYYIVATLIYGLAQLGLTTLSKEIGFELMRDISIASNSLSEFLLNILYTGNAIRGSLWFFPALIFSIGFTYIAEKKNKINIVLGLAFVIHLLAILSNSYELLNLSIPPRDAIFFGLIYTLAGFKIGKLNYEKFSEYTGKLIILSALLLILNILERAFITQITKVQPFFWQDYSFVTLPLAISIFLLGLSRPTLCSDRRINTYGKYTLWGYILHQIFGGILVGLTLGIEIITGFKLIGNDIWNLMLVILTFILTFEAVIFWIGNDIHLRKQIQNWLIDHL
jgi:surface polysaccharide O-acyltransferase-like enzyme